MTTPTHSAPAPASQPAQASEQFTNPIVSPLLNKADLSPKATARANALGERFFELEEKDAERHDEDALQPHLLAYFGVKEYHTKDSAGNPMIVEVLAPEGTNTETRLRHLDSKMIILKRAREAASKGATLDEKKNAITDVIDKFEGAYPLSPSEQDALQELTLRTLPRKPTTSAGGASGAERTKKEAKTAEKDVREIVELAAEQLKLHSKANRAETTGKRWAVGAFVSAYALAFLTQAGNKAALRHGATQREKTRAELTMGGFAIAVPITYGVYQGIRAFLSLKYGIQHGSGNPSPTASEVVSTALGTTSASPSSSPTSELVTSTAPPSSTSVGTATTETPPTESANPPANPGAANKLLPADILAASQKAGQDAIAKMPEAATFNSQLDEISVRNGEGPYSLFSRLGIPSSQHKGFLEFLWDHKDTLTQKNGNDKRPLMYVASEKHHILGLNHTGQFGKNAEEQFSKLYDSYLQDVEHKAEQSKAAELLKAGNLNPADYGIEVPTDGSESASAVLSGTDAKPTAAQIAQAKLVEGWAKAKEFTVDNATVKLRPDSGTDGPGNPWEVAATRVEAVQPLLNPALNPNSPLSQASYNRLIASLDAEMLKVNGDMTVRQSYNLPVDYELKTFSNGSVNEALIRQFVEQATGKSAANLTNPDLLKKLDQIFDGSKEAVLWEQQHTLTDELIDFAKERGLRISNAAVKQLSEHLETFAKEKGINLYVEGSGITPGQTYHINPAIIREIEEWYKKEVLWV